MVVQHNLTAMNSNRMLGLTVNSQAKSTEKLSSGYKINRAADDAAGLTISEKMRRQIRGLNQATLNAQDGISAVQTAEGALTEVHDMLQRMDELATKAANGTMSDNDRQAVQDEMDALITEIDRVSTTTKFNETYLLQGGDKMAKVSRSTAAVEGNDLAVTYKTAPETTPALKDASGYDKNWYLKDDSDKLTKDTILDCVEIDEDGALKVKDGIEIYSEAPNDSTNYGAQITTKRVADSDILALFQINSTALRQAASADAAKTADDLTDETLKDAFKDDGTRDTTKKLWALDGDTWKEVGADQIDDFVNITAKKESVAAGTNEVEVSALESVTAWLIDLAA